jgi:hypothetical protein
MMCTRTIATGAGITLHPPVGIRHADCPPAFVRSSSLGPLGLWCCAVSSPVAAPYSYYNRTGGNDDDERPINGHTAVSELPVRALHPTDMSRAGENHLGSRASGMRKVP